MDISADSKKDGLQKNQDEKHGQVVERCEFLGVTWKSQSSGAARMWKVKDFSLSGGCPCKGPVHPGLVPAGFVGGQQQLGITWKWKQMSSQWREEKSKVLSLWEGGFGGTIVVFDQSHSSPAEMLHGVVHLLKVARGQVALALGWRSNMEDAAPTHCTKSAVKVGGAVKVHPEVPDQVPHVGVKATLRAEPPIIAHASFCIHVANGSPCSKWGLSSVIKCGRFKNNCCVTVKQNSHEIKALLNFYGLKLLHSYSDVHIHKRIPLPLNVMESSTLYGVCNAHKSPLGGSQRTPVWRTLSCGLYGVKTCWFALIHSDGFDISRLLILSDLRWCIVNTRIILSENTSVYEVRASLIPFPTGDALKLRAVISHLIPVEKAPKHYFWFAQNCFQLYFSPTTWLNTDVNAGENKHCLLQNTVKCDYYSPTDTLKNCPQD